MQQYDRGNGDRPEGPWNPGIQSGFTRELLALSTIFRPGNSFNDITQAMELRDVTGLSLEDLAIFRPERLALHEVLVRVTADYEIPDPEDASVSSLGMNLRRMAQTLMTLVVEPNRSKLDDIYREARSELETFIGRELSGSFRRSPAGPGRERDAAPRGLWTWFRRSPGAAAAPAAESEWDRDERLVREWSMRAHTSEAALDKAAFRSLVRVASATRLKHGRILGEHTFLPSLALGLACNDYGGGAIGQFLEPKIRDVAQREGFRQVPAQGRPVTMLTKGASASGKSTMRPLQRKLAAKMGIQWNDFALISPDTWRKALLDFDSLGPLYKYAGMLTSQEVTIIDRKLDAHLVRKGDKRQTSHLLIDRFRFDSFALHSDESKHLPSRFGNLLCYLLMVTPPEETVERAWQRGLEVGRYKSVDDLLAHNVEAYTGMQNILFGRALDPNISVHFEFLDNSVPRGEVPLTAAFGWSGEMNILDVRCILNLERYRKINVDARQPDEVYPDQGTMAAENNAGYLVRCIRKFSRVNFADRGTGRIYARFEAGQLRWIDPEALASAGADPEVQAALHAVAPDMAKMAPCPATTPEFLQPDRFHTIGRWGERASGAASGPK
ncbi:zeta toxin family protein (plasmid) [Skermanella mucosa]|uniref:hypothetical protein n=1 Tax=Skermanella mucosa TaxID=1789672 RepID=UPI00192B06BC|nr:hypothetical protein [Skermanella mucosa]UEM25052.1 zeta toxin family protein [Skermanella mucosa]